MSDVSVIVVRYLWIAFCMLAFYAVSDCAAGGFPEPDKLPARPGLPDPFVKLDGTRITTGQQWMEERRPELKALFQHYMYGYLPAPPENVRFSTESLDADFMDGKATKKEVKIEFGPADAPCIHLLLVIPNDAEMPVPVFLALNTAGNHSVVAEPGVAVSQSWVSDRRAGVKNHRATEAGRGSRAENWAVAETISRGYALATFHESDIDPDKHDFSDGIHPHYFKAGQTEPGPHDWGTIGAWAWGLHRAVDYLYSDEDIDNDRIAVTGHSRRGKTALLAGAMDERIDLVIPHQSGCGGTAPSRSDMGESVTRINKSFPHWFNDVFPWFGGKEERLPFDQHLLIALVAPRPVLVTNGVEDTWANPPGTFKMVQAADPVYRLLGVEGLDLEKQPETGEQDFGRLSYYIRAGGHSLNAGFWKVFLDYADKRFARGADE